MLNILRINKQNRLVKFLSWPLIKILRKNSKSSYDNKIKSFNDAYEKIFSKAVSKTIVLELKEFKGTFEFDVRSDIFKRICFEGRYESNIVEIITEYLNKDKDAIDVGANVGLFSIFMSMTLSSDRKVLSIEPTPNAYNILKKNVLRNYCESRVITFNGAVSDKTDNEMVINTIEGREEYSSLGAISPSYVKDDIVYKIKVESITLDSLVSQYNINPGLIKVDTEGAELLVLYGSINTLKNFKPIIIAEICDNLLGQMNHTSIDVFSFLRSNDYKIINIKSLDENIPFPFTGEIIAIPKN